MLQLSVWLSALACMEDSCTRIMMSASTMTMWCSTGGSSWELLASSWRWSLASCSSARVAATGTTPATTWPESSKWSTTDSCLVNFEGPLSYTVMFKQNVHSTINGWTSQNLRMCHCKIHEYLALILCLEAFLMLMSGAQLWKWWYMFHLQIWRECAEMVSSPGIYYFLWSGIQLCQLKFFCFSGYQNHITT